MKTTFEDLKVTTVIMMMTTMTLMMRTTTMIINDDTCTWLPAQLRIHEPHDVMDLPTNLDSRERHATVGEIPQE